MGGYPTWFLISAHVMIWAHYLVVTMVNGYSLWYLTAQTGHSPLLIHLGIIFHFQEQSYSSFHSGYSLACDDFCGITADPCSNWRQCSRRCQSLRNSLNIVKHHETAVKHLEPLVKHCDTHKTLWNIMEHSLLDAPISALDAVTLPLVAAVVAVLV